MSDPEIIALREVLAKRVRSDDIAQRRRDIDARGRPTSSRPMSRWNRSPPTA